MIASQNHQLSYPDYSNPLDMNVLGIIDQDEKFLSKYIMDNNPTSFRTDGKQEKANAIFVNHEFSKTKMKCHNVLLETMMNNFQNCLSNEEKIKSITESQKHQKQENIEEEYNSNDKKEEEIILKEEAIKIIDDYLPEIEEKSKIVPEKISNSCQKRMYKNKIK